MATKLHIILFLLFLIPISSAIEFNLISPEEAFVEEEIKITIESEEQEPHDVKIFIHQDTKSSSEIQLEDEWKSTRYYLPAAFPGRKEFTLLAHNVGETKVCARIRKSGSSNFDEQCNDIEIIQSEQEEFEEETQEAEVFEDVEESEEIPVRTQPTQEKNTQPEKIILNAPQQNTTDATTFQTKKEKTRLGIVYAFSIFTVIIIILLALRKL